MHNESVIAALRAGAKYDMSRFLRSKATGPWNQILVRNPSPLVTSKALNQS